MAGELVDQRDRHLRRLGNLKTSRSSWDQHWRDLADFIQPRRSRFFQTQANRGEKKNSSIINGTATWAHRTLSSGMMAGITSPARPWFRMTTPDPDLAERGAVREWLHAVEDRILERLARSNVYNALHIVYGDLGLFGTAVCIVDEDSKQLLRAYTVPVGEYCLALSERGQVDTLYRETTLSVSQLVKKFGKDKVSMRVRDLYDRGDYDVGVEVLHFIGPREEYDSAKLDPKNMPWASCWMEKNSSEGGFLRESGYRENPTLAPRWTVTGDDTYGWGPGMEALGDTIAMQTYERRKAQAVERIVDPPMALPATMAGRPASMLPGGRTYLPQDQMGAKIEPLVTIPPAVVQVTEASIQAHAQRIKTAFYADLWLMLAESDNPQMTAREVSERHEEKMLQLGPVMERLEDELLNPLVSRTFGVLLRAGKLPPPPAELQGQELIPEYLSILTQAQKMVSGSAIQQLATFAGGLASLKPEVMDKIDGDAMVDQMGDILGVKPTLIVPDDKVAQIRQQRSQAAAQQQQAQQALAAAQGAKTLSQTDTAGDNALTRLVGGVGAAQVGAGR